MQKLWFECIAVRPITVRDTEAIVLLEKHVSSPWNTSLIEAELTHARSFALAAIVREELIGWCCCRYVRDEAELLKISVAGKWRRRSVATLMLAELEEQLRAVETCCLYLEVRAENQPAISFYLRSGFTVTGRRINYYSQPRDDALVFKKTISHI